MPEIRWWQHEGTGTIHLVSDFEEAGATYYSYEVTTACSLEYLAQSAGFTFDPEKPANEQTSYPRDAHRRCGNCPWEEVLD